MFRGNQINPYDDTVAKATDENLTAENWEVILNLCDKVQEEREQGARNVITALLKRLAHRSPNVQLYALSLAESLSKNCGIELHRELASRAFTGALEKLVVDRTTHEKVRRRTLGLIAMWTADFENEPTLGIMEDCYNSLKAKNYQFVAPSEPPPPAVDDEARRREEEELQRVLEMSMRDKGGRSTYSSPPSAGPSGGASKYASGYVPVNPPSPQAPVHTTTNHNGNARGNSNASGGLSTKAASSTTSLPSQVTPVVTRVRALHTFEPTEPGELAFEKGDVIKVVDRGYKDWWRGQMKGRTGIFPVNYVEPLPEPTAAEIAREAEQEAAVFAQAANVDRLLTMLRHLDVSRESLADNEEIQELYRSCMALRPKIVKLIDKYSQKRADLVSMNEAFVKARTIFDRIMEESLARHAGMYDTNPLPPQPYGYGHDQPQPYVYGGQNNGYQPPPQPHPDPAYAYQQGQPYAGHIGGAPYPQPSMSPYPQSSHTPYPQQAPQQQPHPYQQPQAQQSPEYSPGVHVQQQQQQPQLQSQSQPQPQLPQAQQQPPSAGPPYVFDPNGTYPDPNAKAWAQYYAQGGTDPAGAVYFISVPGVKDASAPPEQPPQPNQPSQDPYHGQAQQQPAQDPYHPQVQQQPAQDPYYAQAHQQPAQDPYHAQAQQQPAQDPYHAQAQQQLTHQNLQAMHQSQSPPYTSPNPAQSQYASQPQAYYQDPTSASAPQVSPTTSLSGGGGASSLRRSGTATSAVVGGVPASYGHAATSPSHQHQQPQPHSPGAQGAGSGPVPHGYAGYPQSSPPASAGYVQSSPTAAVGYAQSQNSLTGPGYGASPPSEYVPGSPYPPGAHGSDGGVHTLQNQFLDMSIGDPQVATS